MLGLANSKVQTQHLCKVCIYNEKQEEFLLYKLGYRLVCSHIKSEGGEGATKFPFVPSLSVIWPRTEKLIREYLALINVHWKLAGICSFRSLFLYIDMYSECYIY